jgi:hypothetical protein
MEISLDEKIFFLIILFFVLFGLTTFSHPSWGIVVNTNGDIYFADIVHNGRGSVWKLSKSGKLDLLLEDFHAHNVSLDSDGNLITAHGEENHTLVRINKNNEIDTIFETFDYQEFNGGNCTYSKDKTIIFGAKNYIWKIGKNQKKEKASNRYFEWNQSVYVDDNGIIYAPDKELDGGAIIQIDIDGKSKIIADNLISILDRPRDKHNDVLLGITKGCDGLIYIAESAGKRIIKINDDSSIETFYKSSGDWFPTGIDFFSGNAFILEYNESLSLGPRIIEIDESGKPEIIFDYNRYFHE